MNAAGQKTRLAFHSAGVLTIGTSDRTQSIPFTSISKIESQKVGNGEYHILALVMGPTEKSNYYLYFVPCQFVDAIKEKILGKQWNWI